MRLQLAAVLLLMGCGHTRTKASSRLHIYSDQRITVVSPSIASDVEVADGVSVALAYDYDAVSGATQSISPDAVSSATHFDEERHQLSLSAAREGNEGALASVSYSGSVEPDHWAHTISAKGAIERIHRRARISAGYSLSYEGIGTIFDETLPDRATTHQINSQWAHIVSTKTVVTALATARLATCTSGVGCRANPYRYAIVDREAGRLAIRERHPNRRIAGAGALRVSHSLSDSLAVHAGYRLFRDTWRVTGHTWDASLARALRHDTLVVRLETRATVESAASFYAPSYEAPANMIPSHRTADAELSGVRNASVGGRVTWTLGWAQLYGRLSHLWMRYPNFKAVPERDAWMISFGLNAER